MSCQLCACEDKNYLETYGGSNFSCGHVVCFFCSTQHCGKCWKYQYEKAYSHGNAPFNWAIKEAGCIICNSKKVLPCGTKYSDCDNIKVPQ